MSPSQRNKNVCRKFNTIIIIIITTQTAHFYNIRAFYTRRPARRWHYLCQQNTVRHHKSTTEAIVTHDKRTAAAAATVLNGRRALTVLLERFTHVAINYGQTGCNNDKQLARQNDPRYLHACFDKIQRSRFI